jgi:hypothetical protein
MSLGPGGFVILFLSTLLPFSGTFNLSVNQGLYTTLGMVSAKKDGSNLEDTPPAAFCTLTSHSGAGVVVYGVRRPAVPRHE